MSFVSFFLLSVDNDYQLFLRATLQIALVLRPNAQGCLNMNFFGKHDIPNKLPFDEFPADESAGSTIDETPTNSNGEYSHTFREMFHVHFFHYFDTDDCSESSVSTNTFVSIRKFDVDYPEIRVRVEATQQNSAAAAQHAKVLDHIFEEFHDICRNRLVSDC